MRLERLQLEPASASDGRPNHWPGVVRARAFRGDSIDHVVAVGGSELRACCDASTSIPPGTAVTVVVPDDAPVLLPG